MFPAPRVSATSRVTLLWFLHRISLIQQGLWQSVIVLIVLW